MKRICAVVLAAILSATWAHAQIICWNLENYFDSKDDPATADEAFTPHGDYRWTRRKYEVKRNLIAKTIIASSECFGGEMPALVGLCEVENSFVLKSLVEDTPLAKVRYSTLHRESPDPRGIDVALLYDPSRVKLLGYGWITVSEIATREILYAKVALGGGAAGAAAHDVARETVGIAPADSCEVTAAPPDTLYLYVNHWPSKYSGAKSSMAKREAVCAALTAHLDSLLAAEPDAKIIVMGDFNDTPDAEVIVWLCEHARLENLTRHNPGTIKFKGQWETIDQLLASPAAAAIISAVDAYKPDFLLEEDKTFMGRKPRRTNIGPRYNGGASDHLPIVAKIAIRQ